MKKFHVATYSSRLNVLKVIYRHNNTLTHRSKTKMVNLKINSTSILDEWTSLEWIN